MQSYKAIFVTLFVSVFVAMLGIGVIAPIMPLYATTLCATGMGLGIIYSAFSVSRMVVMPFTGRLSDKFDRKRLLIAGLSMYTLASLGYIWSDSISELILVRLLHGIGSASVIPIATAIVGDISPKGKEGSVMGTFQVATFLGFGVGPLLGGVVRDMMSVNAVFLLMGAMSLFSLLLIVFFLPSLPQTAHKKGAELTSLRELIKNRSFIAIFIFRFTNAVGRGVIIAFLPILASKLELVPTQIGLLVSANILFTSALLSVFGKLSDRVCRHSLVIIGSLGGSLPLFFIPLAQNLGHLLFFSLLFGLGAGIAFPAIGALSTNLGREHGMGSIMGFLNTGMSIGQIFGPVMAGILMDLFGLNSVFLFTGIAGVIGVITYILLLKKEINCPINRR